MVSNKGKAKTNRRSMTNLSDRFEKNMDENFERTFELINAATMSALISGVAPTCIQASLSYGFLFIASKARTGNFELWISDPDLVWEPVLGAILDFVDTFDGEIDAGTDLAELKYLQEECVVKNMPLSEFEDRRHSKTAHSIFEWLLQALGKKDHELIFAELAFLIAWFKVGAITKDCSQTKYQIIRQNPPEVMASYDSLVF